MTLKYAIHPGYVISKYDGDEHFITFNQLVRLYKLDPRECFNWDESSSLSHAWHNYIHLYPKYHGDYTICDE